MKNRLENHLVLGFFDARTRLPHYFIRVTMLVSAIKKSVPCNLRRIAACVTYRNEMRTKIAQQCESHLLSTSPPNIAACRIYSTESDSKPSLPMLVDDAKIFAPSFFFPLRTFFVYFKSIRHIDKEFNLFDVLDSTRYAITVISNALANEDYDSLEGLVAEDMIEILRTKISTLSPEQKSLIAAKEIDLYAISTDISVRTDSRTDEEHSIEIKVIYHHAPDFAEQVKSSGKMGAFIHFPSTLRDSLICNYTFVRKYVNNVGGPWIATFVNHYSINAVVG